VPLQDEGIFIVIKQVTGGPDFFVGLKLGDKGQEKGYLLLALRPYVLPETYDERRDKTDRTKCPLKRKVALQGHGITPFSQL
jgi:hypothetical protein